jgi:polyphosphate kinase 2 (PPK2 family)
LGELQLPQIAHHRRVIILFEGPQGAGKKFALKQLAAALDPCHFVVHSTSYDRREASEGHWLARFWRQLPSAGHTAIFFRSWYRRVLEDRVLGRTVEESVARVFDEINEFEAQQRDYGTLLVKLYFDVSADVQEQRLAQRRQSPWRGRHADDELIRADDPAYQRALEELRANTDTRWSPWRTIDGDDDRQAALAALEAIAEAWSKAMPAKPPQLVTAPHVA